MNTDHRDLERVPKILCSPRKYSTRLCNHTKTFRLRCSLQSKVSHENTEKSDCKEQEVLELMTSLLSTVLLSKIWWIILLQNIFNLLISPVLLRYKKSNTVLHSWELLGELNFKILIPRKKNYDCMRCRMLTELTAESFAIWTKMESLWHTSWTVLLLYCNTFYFF